MKLKMGNQLRKSMKTKSLLFEKINKIDMALSEYLRKKREGTQITKTTRERENTSIYTIDTKRQ